MLYRSGFKRLLDIVASSAALVVLSPLLAVIALAILLDDGRPVIFRQRRVGRGGVEFVLLKFRSMPTGTAEIPSGQLAAPRITRVGRFLRRTNLDELPQLVNILRGDMSVVGPRPPLPSQTELVDLRRRSGALECRPGLTGLAQVSSYDGMSAEEKASYDGDYVKSMSFLNDMRIVWQTVGYLRKTPPVY
jgi:O-antigen biosynthesis protein WbqP